MGTLAIDASSPASVFNNATSSTCASFTPPSGALLVVWMRYNTGTGDTPGTPTITDSLGVHLTYTQREHNRRPDSPAAEGALVVWTAIATGAAMTITTASAGVVATGNALKVQAWTDSSGGTPGVGTILKTGSVAVTNSITSNVLCTVTGANAVIGMSNWDASGIPVAGTGCTATGGDAADQGSTLAYCCISRTTPDGIQGANIPLIVNSIGGGANIRWISMEITPATNAAPTTPGTPVASNITHNTADLSWTASTDDVAVTGYEIEIVGP